MRCQAAHFERQANQNQNRRNNILHARKRSRRSHQNQQAARNRRLAILRGWQVTRQHPARTQRDAQVADLDALGEDFEKASKGFIDFLLLNEKGFPFIVLEAKAEDKRSARRQGTGAQIRPVPELPLRHSLERQPALLLGPRTRQSLCHYLVPHARTRSPATKRPCPIPSDSSRSRSGDDYVVLTQRPGYAAEAAWKNETERARFIDKRPPLPAPLPEESHLAIQRAVKNGSDRFLFEMATGTGKTLTAAAIIKLFLRTGNARRVLFLVDRLELEDQA